MQNYGVITDKKRQKKKKKLQILIPSMHVMPLKNRRPAVGLSWPVESWSYQHDVININEFIIIHYKMKIPTNISWEVKKLQNKTINSKRCSKQVAF